MKMRFVAIAVLSLMIPLCGTVSSVFANELATLTGRITLGSPLTGASCPTAMSWLSRASTQTRRGPSKRKMGKS